MKLQVPCNQCIQEFIQSGGKNHSLLSFSILSVNDDGIYELECSRGHKSVTTLSAEKFEILFEIGANAILDGYYREAVSSFTSSLERFYEFFINLVSIKHGILEDAYEKTWKHLRNQSERQIGAFVIVWLFETGNEPSQLSSKWRGFRNNVIHKGKIPTREEAIGFGNTILSLLQEGIELVRSSYEDQRGILMGRSVMKFPQEKYLEHTGGGMGISTIASVHNRDAPKTLEEGLKKLGKARELTSILEQTGLTNHSK